MKHLFFSIILGIALLSCKSQQINNSNIINGIPWFDNNGNVVNAHGGGILYHEGKYYWYGEYKGDSTYWNPKVPSWECYRTEAGGVSCYSSDDLTSWKFEGVVLKAEQNDTASDLHYSNVLERPKVIYNDQTGQFVMWLHVDSHDYGKAAAGVAVCDSPTGDFQYLGSMRPNGQMSRDMTLFKDGDGRAYHIYSSEHNRTLYISLLTDDYLQPSGIFTRNFVDKSREAPAVFKRNNRYYMLSSGCTGWDPNQAEYAVADSMLGKWTVMGNPCRGKDADITFYGQSTFALPVAGKKDAYIALFDKWNKTDLINSRYIWLPVTFNGDSIVIEWREKWDLNEVFVKSIAIKPNLRTGAIDELTVRGDESGMNWILKTDGSQYPWVKEKYGWGLGYFQLKTKNEELKTYAWERAEKISADGMNTVYQAGDIRINVDRRYAGNDLVECYTFTNTGKENAGLSGIGIYTPFNDNYPDAATCINSRTNAHIWNGGNAAYVNALRMGGYAPHLGLTVTEGAVESYEIHERGINRANSQFRGVIALNPPDITLKKGEKYTLSWRIFSHGGNEDFENKLLEYGGIIAKSDKYTVEKGDTVTLSFLSRNKLINPMLYLNGKKIPMTENVAKAVVSTPGENRFELVYSSGKKTHIDVLCISNIENLIAKRVDFILKNQQMNDSSDARFGALMVYDNELNKIYLNDTPNCNPVDRDEGAERVGMGVLLAKQYRLHPSPELKASLLRYAKFLREKLQTADYVTYSSVDRKGRNRGYNYMWVAMFYFEMYKITGNRQFATDGYETLQAMYRQFGYGFYAIHIPVRLGLQALKAAGMTDEYEDLKNDFLQVGDIFIKNGLNYPKHEVNYEQSIVAPAISFLAQLYLETGIQKYLDEARRQLPVLETFNGQQPSYHLNDIAIRHWDGYWFGKRETFGDTFPHYWSVLTGEAFYYYALCTGDSTYQRRAGNIVRNNLCLFSEDGRASCAYLYPCKINGIKAQFYDEYANDQDWALVSYLTVNNK